MKKAILTLGVAAILSSLNASALDPHVVKIRQLPRPPVTHCVPDAGSTLALVGVASLGLAWISRRVKRG